VIFIQKRTRILEKKEFKRNASKSAILCFSAVNCGKIQGQFVILLFKTEMEMVSGLMSMLV